MARTPKVVQELLTKLNAGWSGQSADRLVEVFVLLSGMVVYVRPRKLSDR